MFEFLAVSTLPGNVRGRIILLSRPLVERNTSIVRSVSKELNRYFYRFFVGRMGDGADTMGHRRTYFGGIPGKFVQPIKNSMESNQVIMIDAIHKMRRRWTG